MRLEQREGTSTQIQRRRVRTLEMNNLPKATRSPFSATSNADARVNPPAAMRGRGAHSSRTKSFDYSIVQSGHKTKERKSRLTSASEAGSTSAGPSTLGSIIWMKLSLGQSSLIRDTRYVKVGFGSSIRISGHFLISTRVFERRTPLFDTIESRPRTQTNSSLFHSNSACNGINDVQSEFASVLNRSTVFVSPLVRYVLQKLVDEVAICSVQLNSIESCAVNGINSSSCVQLSIFFNLYKNSF